MKFFNAQKQYIKIKKEINSAVTKVLSSGVFIGGKEVQDFEKTISKFCNVKHAISVNSGTDALFLSLMALGIGKGDEVITSPFTFVATAEAIANVGATPVFVDIDRQSFNIDYKKIEEKINKNTKAIIPVHLFGQMADMDEIIKIVKKYKLFIIEDAAQSIGSEYKGNEAGSMGDCGCFSFFPTKNLGACGDGGIITTDDQELAEKIHLLKNHGSSGKEKYLNLALGFNSRLDSIQASILKVKLRHLKEWNKKRFENARYYNKKLLDVSQVIPPVIVSDGFHVFHQYTIRAEHRDNLKKYLENKGIPTIIYYALPLHLQPAFRYLNYRKGDFPEAEKAVSEVLSLPIYPELSKKDRNCVIEKIKEFYEIK